MFRALIPTAAALVAIISSAQAGELWVNIDKVTRYQLPDEVGRVIVTNPAVADIEVASATELMFFGRMPGLTEVIFQDADGKRLGQVRVRVGNDTSGLVTLYNGAERYSFSCTKTCEQTPTIGDGTYGAMAQVIGQVGIKAAAASNGRGLSEEAVQVERPQPMTVPQPGS